MGDSTTTATVLTATATVVCVCASFCPISYHKSTGGRSSSATSSRQEVLDAPEELRQPVVGVEERKKSRGKRGSLCARRRSRKTVTCHGRRVVEPVYIRPYCAADGGAGGELRARASLAAVTVSRHIRLASFCAFVQSRRRPEKWTRTGKWDSRRSVTVDFVCGLYSFWFTYFFTRRRWR